MNKYIKIDAATEAVGALNFSHLLDAPAGCHGQTIVKDGSLYFEDGKRARFVGFNIPAGGMMPKKETAEAYAKRLASMGCNVVRLHAEDSVGWNKEIISTIDYSEEGKGRKLQDEYMDRLFYFVAELKKRGIYVQVDLHCYRVFTNTGDLKVTPPKMQVKAMSIFNQELIDLQKEYATQYLSAVNPYTGMSFLEDPVVMCIQITNENSAFWVNVAELGNPDRAPYEEERKLRFNAFLLKKYGTREALAEAWTRNGECALMAYEDPEKGTVEPIEYGDYAQPYRDHREYWVGLQSPARYADYMEYGMELNMHYYKEMIDHVRSLGAKAPINGCNLLHGIADIYSSTREIDVAENNAYYNHPMGGDFATGMGIRYTWHENVKTDPRKTTYSVFEIRDNHHLQQLGGAALKNTPYIVSEWNEYGGMPFHSTAYLMQAAYACLQNWDGLILYSFIGEDDHTKLADDYIWSVYSIYNDPSAIGQFGAMATIFLNGDVKEAKRIIDMCFTDEDMKMLPENYKMPYGFLPFVSKTRTVFVGDKYADDGDLAVNGGFASNGDYSAAKKALIYARSPYADAMQHEYIGSAFLDANRGENAEIFPNIGTISDTRAVIDLDKIDGIERMTDYTGFSRFADAAMKKWGLWDENVGLVDIDHFVSDTGEISYNFGKGQFSIDTETAAVFSGYAYGKPVKLGPVTANIKNEKMTFSLLPRDNKKLSESKHMVILATGNTGNDGNKWAGDISLGFGGKLAVEDPEGTLEVDAKEVYALDIYGNRLYALTKDADGRFVMGTGEAAALGFEIIR
ncbi:MAG: glycoside hydrolase family 5 protein [Clostridiales bacterium]|nr:glycoside hydrolase family 5 protein [Clostridiales bacterium]